jgi:polar amino acid transport system substrate-binding protein
MRRIVQLIFLSQIFFYASSYAQEINSVTVCNDPAPPPAGADRSKPGDDFFTYLIKTTFSRIGIKATFIVNYPFKRCLNEVENRRIDFVMGAYFDAERAKVFDYSSHYYTLTPQLFYLANRPVQIEQLADLKKYRGCGIYGSSYAHYGLRPEDLDLGPGYTSMFNKLHANRCDYFVEELEVIQTLDAAGRNYLNDTSITHTDVPGAVAPSRYLVTAKNSKASAILGKFNKALEDVINSAEAREIWKKENGNVTYKQ